MIYLHKHSPKPVKSWTNLVWRQSADDNFNAIFLQTCTIAGYPLNAVPRSLMALWRHQIETFSALLAICAGNSPITGEFPAQRPVTWSFDVFFDLCLNKRLINNREAGDLRRHHSHYDVTLMNGAIGLANGSATKITRWLSEWITHAFTHSNMYARNLHVKISPKRMWKG